MARRDDWRAWPLGARVVVRRRLAEGGYSDSVGVLLERTEERLLLDTKRGEVSVPTHLIAVGKLISPPIP